MAALRIFARARAKRCAIVGTGTRKARAISGVDSPPSVCIVQRILSQREISKLADERRQNTPMFFAESGFDLRGCGHMLIRTCAYYCAPLHKGRTSIVPQRALGIFDAQLVASSRSLHSMR